jgi:hypothetical protein
MSSFLVVRYRYHYHMLKLMLCHVWLAGVHEVLLKTVAFLTFEFKRTQFSCIQSCACVEAHIRFQSSHWPLICRVYKQRNKPQQPNQMKRDCEQNTLWLGCLPRNFGSLCMCVCETLSKHRATQALVFSGSETPGPPLVPPLGACLKLVLGRGGRGSLHHPGVLCPRFQHYACCIHGCGVGSTPQISLAYCAMVRSLEKKPLEAV